MQLSDQIIRTKEVCRMTGLSKTTLWRLQKSGKFPKNRKISDHSVGFLFSEIENWISGSKHENKI